MESLRARASAIELVKEPEVSCAGRAEEPPAIVSACRKYERGGIEGVGPSCDRIPKLGPLVGKEEK